MRVPLLDHGYVELVEAWGSEERIVEAARMSTGKGFTGWGPTVTKVRQCVHCQIVEDVPGGQDDCFDPDPRSAAHVWGLPEIERSRPGDEKLLRFLYENKHATPFEMAGLVIEVQAPIFVFREWHRHRTQSYNELSARYTPLPDVNYIPALDNVLKRARAAERTSNKQAQAIKAAEDADLYDVSVQGWLRELLDLYANAQRVYDLGLRIGVPKELARLPVPVARYSRMRASANLRNWLAFLTLRMAPNAQWEIRQYANAVGDVVAETFPRTWALFCEGRTA